jgi:hypothetical protein
MLSPLKMKLKHGCAGEACRALRRIKTGRPEPRQGQASRPAAKRSATMSRNSLFVVATAVSLLHGAGAQAAAVHADDPATVERGRPQCHAIRGQGESPNAAAPPFRQLYRRYPAGALEEAFRNGLLTRHPAMPQIRLLPGEIVDLTAYVKSVQNSGEANAPNLLQQTSFGGP